MRNMKKNVNGMRKTSHNATIHLNSHLWRMETHVIKYMNNIHLCSVQQMAKCRVARSQKEPLEYFQYYHALNDEWFKNIYFQAYCSVAIGCLFLTPWKRPIEENISQMMNEVCKKVGTKYFIPGAKIDEEGMDVHPHHSAVI